MPPRIALSFAPARSLRMDRARFRTATKPALGRRWLTQPCYGTASHFIAYQSWESLRCAKQSSSRWVTSRCGFLPVWRDSDCGDALLTHVMVRDLMKRAINVQGAYSFERPAHVPHGRCSDDPAALTDRTAGRISTVAVCWYVALPPRGACDLRHPPLKRLTQTKASARVAPHGRFPSPRRTQSEAVGVRPSKPGSRAAAGP
jgi:hypothetical protein